MTFPDSSWRKSRHSGSETNCVEIAHSPGEPLTGIRDSKHPAAGHLTFGHTAVRDLLGTVAR